jgi:uncharacterized membrane protein YeaQ/YmgE (transglycosylase-associated protein family)
MNILAWIVLGLVAGVIAKLIVPGKDPGGFIVTILLGVAGAIVGGWVGTAAGFTPVSGFNLGGLVVAVLGAVLLLLIYRLLRKRG